MCVGARPRAIRLDPCPISSPGVKAVWTKDAIPSDMTLCYSASTNLFEKWSIGLLLA